MDGVRGGSRVGAREVAATRTAVAVAIALGATITVVVVPNLRFAYGSTTTKVACETASALIAALASFLVLGRRAALRRPGDELTGLGLALIAMGDVLLVALPSTASEGSRLLTVITWTPLGFHASGALAMACAAIAPHRVPLTRDRLAPWVAVLSPVVAFPALALMLGLPADTARTLPLAAASSTQLQREPLVAAVQLAIGSLLALASVGFARRATSHDDRLSPWLSTGCGLTAVGRLNFALFPSLFSQWLYTGDVIRLLGYACWLAGSAFEIASYWRALADAAVVDERRRLARDLHDGLAQELAFVASEVKNWDTNGRHPDLTSAIERALGESRSAIAALSDTDVPFDEAIRRAVEELGRRYGVRVVTDFAADLGGSRAVQEAVVRIAREATSNACRHGEPTRIDVRVERAASGFRLVVADDGRGFDQPASTGFGITSMTERAELIGGRCVVASAPARGTTVVVEWP